MKLLIVTQTVDLDNPVLGFFHRWIEEFAKHAESVQVICLKEGRHVLPQNVHVHSLGKENSSASRVTYARRFLSLVWRLRHGYDTVFVHMNPEYVVLAGWLWRLMGKRIGLWYTHKKVDCKLRGAVCWANEVFSASKESFRMKISKLHVVGHAIDAVPLLAEKRVPYEGTVRVLTTGRLSATKRILEMLTALDLLAKKEIPFTFTVAGAPATPADEAYEKEVRAAITERPYAERVALLGGIAHADIPKQLAQADVFINLSKTGSMDKAVLEAIIAGVPVVTTNEAFRDMLMPLGLFIEDDTAEALAEALEKAVSVDVSHLAKETRERFALAGTISKVYKILKGNQ